MQSFYKTSSIFRDAKFFARNSVVHHDSDIFGRMLSFSTKGGLQKSNLGKTNLHSYGLVTNIRQCQVQMKVLIE